MQTEETELKEAIQDLTLRREEAAKETAPLAEQKAQVEAELALAQQQAEVLLSAWTLFDWASGTRGHAKRGLVHPEKIAYMGASVAPPQYKSFCS